MPQSAHTASPSPEPRLLPSVQRTGGPLSPSIRNEVEAAVERAAGWLSSRNTLPTLDTEENIIASAWALAIEREYSSGEYPPVSERTEARENRLRKALEYAAGNSGKASFLPQWLMLEALLNQGQPSSPDYKARLSAAFAETTRSIHRESGSDTGIGLVDARNLLALCDAMALAGGGRSEQRIPGPDRKDAVVRRLIDLIDKPALEKNLSEPRMVSARKTMAAVLLSTYFPPGNSMAWEETALAHLLAAWKDLTVKSMFEDPEASWHLIRALNRMTPNLLSDESQAQPEFLDWRKQCARYLLGSQKIEPSTGFGFWQGRDSPRDKEKTVTDFNATVFAVRMLLLL